MSTIGKGSIASQMASFNLQLDGDGNIRRRSSILTVLNPASDKNVSAAAAPAAPTTTDKAGKAPTATTSISWLDERMVISERILTQAQWLGAAVVLGCIFAISALLALCDREAYAAQNIALPRLSTIHSSTALAFAFAVALNALSSIHASSLERRVLSTIMCYVSVVACLSYVAMAHLPLATAKTPGGVTVFFMRYIEWALTCPSILIWTSLVSCQTWREAAINVAGDVSIILIGVVGPFLPPLYGFFAMVVANGLFIYLMYHLFASFGLAMEPGFSPLPPVPRTALNMMRWEIIVSWTIFPIMDAAIHLGLVEIETGESVICGADYAAKAGLAIILTNCNLEQVTALIADYLVKEQKRTSELLYSILPKTIARQLSEGKKVQAERHPNVAILFSDIKGFTTISSTVEPKEVMAMLNLLFSKFDVLCEKHDVYKVETIGDAYMVVSGLPDKKDNPADALADFALDMIEAANTVVSPSDGRPLQIRVGVHAGAVTSGVVGHVRPRYTLFGDTVNTASRMESTGIPNRIQMSQAFYDSLRHPEAYSMPCRGQIEVKGKGLMTTYMLHRLGSVLPADVDSEEKQDAHLHATVCPTPLSPSSPRSPLVPQQQQQPTEVSQQRQHLTVAASRSRSTSPAARGSLPRPRSPGRTLPTVRRATSMRAISSPPLDESEVESEVEV